MNYNYIPEHDEDGQQQRQAVSASSTVQGFGTFVGNVNDESSSVLLTNLCSMEIRPRKRHIRRSVSTAGPLQVGSSSTC